MSVSRMALPLAVENVTVVSSTSVCVPGTTFTGASFTPATVIVAVATLLSDVPSRHLVPERVHSREVRVRHVQ